MAFGTLSDQFYQITEKGVLLHVRLTPKSDKNKIKGIICDAQNKFYLAIYINALPEDGKANKELIKFMSKRMSIKSQAISLKGEHSRIKQLFIETTKGRELMDAFLAKEKPLFL